MDPVEWQIRSLVAAFYAQPEGAQWARLRARELVLIEPVTVVVLWGRHRWDVGRLPHNDPSFAIRRADGSIERPPWMRRR